MRYQNIPYLVILIFLHSVLFSSFSANAAQQFAGGTRASASLAGVSIKIPEGFNATYNADVGGLIIEGGQVTLAFFAVSHGEVTPVGEVVMDLLRELGIQLQPTNVTQPTNDRLDANFSAWYQGQPKSMLGTVRKGPYNNAIAVVGMSQPGQDAAINSRINAIIDSIQWSEPKANEQSQKLMGLSLSRSSGSSDGHSGVGGFTASTNVKEQMELCSNGQYSYSSISESFISTAGASMPSSSRSQHQGKWWLIADIGGNFYLYLESTANQYYIWPVSDYQNGVGLNGKNYTATKSQQCL
jgi:hypothetical protein